MTLDIYFLVWLIANIYLLAIHQYSGGLIVTQEISFSCAVHFLNCNGLKIGSNTK